MPSIKTETCSYDVSIATDSGGGVEIFVDPKWSGEPQSVYLNSDTTRKLLMLLIGDMTVRQLAELVSEEDRNEQ